MGENQRNNDPTAALAALTTVDIAAASQDTAFASSAVATSAAVAAMILSLHSHGTCVPQSSAVAYPRARPVVSTNAVLPPPLPLPHHHHPPHHSYPLHHHHP